VRAVVLGRIKCRKKLKVVNLMLSRLFTANEELRVIGTDKYRKIWIMKD
jgi:hypothetical protein